MREITKKDISAIVEAILKIKGGRGYSVGQPYKEFQGKPVYGLSDYHYENEEKESEDKSPVEISKAFKGDRHDRQ